MKRLIFLIILIGSLNVNAQDYLISFTGTGASTTVNSVIIENLENGTTLTVNGTDVLRLTTPVGIHEALNNTASRIKIYPNPMTEKSTLLISAPTAGDAVISICDITGKVVTRTKCYLENYTREFIVSGLLNGIYIVNVKSNSYQFSGKLISNCKSNSAASIEPGSDNISIEKKLSEFDAKGVQATVDMAYNPGEILKFTGISGDYSTVITDIPSENKPIAFNFMQCTDGDGNNYPVVAIGTQVWMATNLKTTKYNNATCFHVEFDNMTWANLTSPAYCWYNNDAPSNKDIYGALYNAYAVNTGKLCPVGWHVPTNTEWDALLEQLDSNAGGKMKEIGSAHWTYPNVGGTNASGFTALGGGARLLGGVFSDLKMAGYWWSSTEMSPQEYGSRNIVNWDAALFSTPGYKTNGYSVRCLKD